MIHDARIVWTDGRPHAPATCAAGSATRAAAGKGTRWSSTPPTSPTRTRSAARGENLHLVERFTRTDANTLLYEFTVDDPATFTRPWTAQLPMTKSDERIFEYACHEGNYALPDILRGARYQERQGKSKCKLQIANC